MRLSVRWLVVLGSLTLAQCRPASKQEKEFSRSETLYLGGIQWGEPTSFNPHLDSASWPSRVPMNILYEPLLWFDPQSGKMEPALAESYQMKEEGIEITLDPRARWNDGRPVTAWDVLFTYEMGKKYKNLRNAPVWEYLEDIRLPEVIGKPPPPPEAPISGDYPRKVFFVYKKDRQNPLVVLDVLQMDFIFPRHVHQVALNAAKGDINEFLKLKLDQNPVASGPYRLHSYSGEKIILVRDESYWGNDALFAGKKPGPKYVIHQIYKSNDHFSIGLQQGRLDITSTFIPRIWLKHKKKVFSWYAEDPFYPPAAFPMLFINVTRPPLNDTRLRRAMALAINYQDIRELAVSGYSPPLKPGLILPFGLESSYYSVEDAARFGASFDPAKAKELLQRAGYRSIFDGKGNLVEMRDPQGQKVPALHITSPAGWTDWEAIVRIVVKSLRAVGIDVRERFVDGNVYWPAPFKGDFDFIMYTPAAEATPSKPWSRFEFVMTSNGWAPEGEKMYKNFGRFNNPKGPDYLPRIDELLNQIPLLTDEQEKHKAYRELNVLFMQTQPTLPLVYRPEQFFQYSLRHWKGFPSGKNAFAPSYIPSYRAGTRILWNLEPVSD